METLLKPGYEKILSLFYNDKHAKIHLRDIVRKAGMNENSVSRFLNHLEKKGVLRSEKDGNMKKYSIQKNGETFVIFAYFDVQRFNKLPSIRRNAIIYFMKELKEKPIIALLFGSTAKNTFTKDSDMDLLLVVNKKISVEGAERYAESQTAVRIKCIQIPYEDFLIELKMKQDSTIQSALGTGYPLTNHMMYYGGYFNENLRP